VVKISLKEDIEPIKAVAAVANALANFMQKNTGRGYEPALEVGQPNEIIVREPGHQYYGLKVFSEGRFIYISRVAILEDETILQQFVDHLHLLDSEESTP